MGLVLKYVQEPNDSRNHFRYRRRVLDSLRPHLGKTELLATLGTSREAALKAYPSSMPGSKVSWRWGRRLPRRRPEASPRA